MPEGGGRGQGAGGRGQGAGGRGQGAGGRGQGAGGRGKENLKYILPISPPPHLPTSYLPLPPAPCPLHPCLFSPLLPAPCPPASSPPARLSNYVAFYATAMHEQQFLEYLDTEVANLTFFALSRLYQLIQEDLRDGDRIRLWVY